MNRDTSSRHGCGSHWRRVSGACLLALYVFAGTPSFGALTAFLATADRSHHVIVRKTGTALDVVLHHGFVRSSSHQHGIAARALVLVAQQPSQAQPDHVIHLGTTAASEAISAPAMQAWLAATASKPVRFPEIFPGAGLKAMTGPGPRPPPEASGLLLSLRSTVLLV